MACAVPILVSSDHCQTK